MELSLPFPSHGHFLASNVFGLAPPLLLSHILVNIQYFRFGATLKIMKIINFCPTYKLICIVSKTRFWHLSKTSSKNRPFYKVEILEIPQVFTLFLSSQGPNIQVPKLTFRHQKNSVRKVSQMELLK